MKPVLGSRALFPTLEPEIYLNHAAISPISLPAREAIMAAMDGYARRGVAHFSVEMERRDRLRGGLGRLMNVSRQDLAFIPNTSAGVSAIAVCLPWKRGDRVLLFTGEFPANVTPWQRAAQAHGLELVWMDSEAFRLDREAALDAFARVLKDGVRLVAASFVQFATGQRMPIAEMGALCTNHGAELFVDAIQGLGVVPMDVPALGIHYLSAGGHKWLMGAEGTGVLYVEPGCAAKLRPQLASWLSHKEPFDFLFAGAGYLRYDRPIVPHAGMMEGGASNVYGLAALAAGVEMLEFIGVEQIYTHVQRWHDAAESGLTQRGFLSARMSLPSGRSGTLSVRPPPGSDVPTWTNALAARGVSCASPDGWMRFAPHWPNAISEVERLLEIVDAIAADATLHQKE